VRTLTLALAAVLGLAAQTVPDWRRVGGPAVDLQLAGPATGPVIQVWYSADGSALYARTASGQVFRTSDFANWTPPSSNDAGNDAAAPVRVIPARLPEANATVVASNPGSARIFAFRTQLWASGDGGQTWLNLTSYRAASVVGPGQNSVAVSPNDDRQIVLANEFGVWRSLDGGLSWDGLNLTLPNLSVVRILSTPTGVAGARVLTNRLGALEMAPGNAVWSQAPAPEVDAENSAKRRYANQLGLPERSVTTVVSAGDTVYVGSSDGRVWTSLDDGRNFLPPKTPSGAAGPVQRIWVDPTRPRVALAVMGGKGARVLRTTNSGDLWDSLDEMLPDGAVHGITADRPSGAVYVATDKGIFYALTNLEDLSAPPSWTNLSDRLPGGAAKAAALDVRLDPAGVQLYAAVDGYGVFATPAPHRTRSLRIVNTADYTTRAAAPGSLLSVIGGYVNAATGENLNYPVLVAADSESQIQVPFEAQGPNVNLRLVTAGGTFTRPLTVQPVSPGILVGRDGAPMLWDADTGLPVNAGNAAHSNGRLQVWATGLGKTRPDWRAGLPAPMENPPEVVAQVHAYLDGQALQVTKATLVPGYVGFYLVEVQLPVVNNLGPSELYISAGGQDSNKVQVILEP